MKQFIHPDFILHSETGKRLYHEYASKLPIIDFHCHLSPEMIAIDRQFDNLGQIWLEGDHYKWRAMRSNGIDEKFCTGKVSDYEKFEKWAQTVPYTIGNPLYHWTHLELVRYFGINEQLSPSTAKSIYDQATALLRSPEYTVRGMMRKMNVELVCTTDDPVDSLEFHLKLKNEFEIKVLPTFRPDRVLRADDPALLDYLKQLGQVADVDINSFSSLVTALDKRHAFFTEVGCKLSDHGLDRFFYAPYTQSEVDAIFAKVLAGKSISDDELEKYRTAVLLELARMNHKRGWTQQFHVGALRNNNSRKFRLLGADTGWDSIGNPQDSFKMSRFLDMLDTTDQLAQTILYNLNPADNEMMATMIGNFNDGTAPGKIQYGAAWWFLDQKTGMEEHLKALSALGLTTRFVGMVTDSRSFLSYPRHEYFRRIVCEFFGSEVDKGHIPNDDSLLKPAVEGISYYNAKNYFKF
ncbi:glucuronate isomerase [Breznakibacter xylanolyticus]|uniref:Uronate isomerase n=1 Tax=Breznakibacter xylanolyticus TaxID=990 RepID=A0A2W7P467_9BACT|nr:glucuronate isomerase [Breznakibacter xylanolyticus]PZX20146.1 glucuronate isomerase [Breznakibacter xylanolyticus]